MDNYTIIEKEAIANLQFPNEEVLHEIAAQKQRAADLQNVTVLGNAEHIKVEIFFKDATSKYRVNTTVWGVTDIRVILKQGILIPINRIVKISY